jgi:hypothetical protein
MDSKGGVMEFKQYKVVSATTVEDLEHIIDAYGVAGWQLYGDAFIKRDGIVTTFYQVIVVPKA